MPNTIGNAIRQLTRSRKVWPRQQLLGHSSVTLALGRNRLDEASCEDIRYFICQNKSDLQESMLRMMTASFSAAAITGLGTAYATALAFGPIASIGFAVGSCVGFVASVIHYWHTSIRASMMAFDDHPELMYLHLLRNYPDHGLQRVKMDQPEVQANFRRRLRGPGMEGLTLRCYMMASWHTAAPAIEVCSRITIESGEQVTNTMSRISQHAEKRTSLLVSARSEVYVLSSGQDSRVW
jgi:hypothetical protein